MEFYDISFLKNYLKQKGISQTAVANYLKISRQYMSILLNGQQSANQNHLNINVRYDISPLKKYISKYNISIKKLSNYFNVSYNVFDGYLNGKNKCDTSIIYKLLSLFKVKTYAELINLISNSETPNLLSSDLLYSYDISFLKDYFDNNNIQYKDFFILIGTDYQTCIHLLTGIRKISYNNPLLYKIYECFEVDTYDELKESVNNNIVPDKIKNFVNEDKVNINFLKDYLKLNNMCIRNFAKQVDINYSSMSAYLNRNISIPKERLDKILKYFNVEYNNELEEYCYINGKKKYELINLMIITEILSNKIDNNLLEKYLYNTKINIDIDLNILLDIVKDYRLKDNYMEVILLIFNKKYNFSIYEISSITQVSCEKVTKILRDSIKLYIEKYYEDYTNEEDLKILIK